MTSKTDKLNIDFEAVRNRIAKEKGDLGPKAWGERVGVSANTVTNAHPKDAKKAKNPTLPYIISVAKHTGKSVEYFLWGEEPEDRKEDLEENENTEVNQMGAENLKWYQDRIAEKDRIIMEKDAKIEQLTNQIISELKKSGPVPSAESQNRKKPGK